MLHGHEHTKASLRRIKIKMAECVRQNFPSVAKQEQEKHFTFRSGDPEEDKNRQNDVQDFRRDADDNCVIIKQYA